MTRFLNRINQDIQDVVEYYHYKSLQEVVHKAKKVDVEQGALMSQNPRGMLEDLAVGCVCV